MTAPRAHDLEGPWHACCREQTLLARLMMACMPVCGSWLATCSAASARHSAPGSCKPVQMSIMNTLRARMLAQVYIYKLPSLPGATLGYATTGSPLQPPNNQGAFFGSGGLCATEGAEYIYVASPVAPQPSSQLLNLYGNASVYVYSVSGAHGRACAASAWPAWMVVSRAIIHGRPHGTS